jgi:hypothetical protein
MLFKWVQFYSILSVGKYKKKSEIVTLFKRINLFLTNYFILRIKIILL